MRKIKFRAWDKEKRKIVYFGLFSILVDGIENSEYWIKQYKNGLRNLEIMQYTGLKDKNGKEIYEGDILKIKEDWDEYGWKAGEIGDVIFEEYFYGISLNSQNKPGTKYTVYLDVDNGKDVEIIGNVYENKDLIK
ncbi:MAG: hypothetical protein KAT66_00335 [Candidatus Lokiarchaeota archaeon]|nr:hypothetical protein [Candidatus Lokiarchaeota archaeon]